MCGGFSIITIVAEMIPYCQQANFFTSSFILFTYLGVLLKRHILKKVVENTHICFNMVY